MEPPTSNLGLRSGLHIPEPRLAFQKNSNQVLFHFKKNLGIGDCPSIDMAQPIKKLSYIIKLSFLRKDVHAYFQNNKKYYMLLCQKIFKLTRKLTKSTTSLLRELKTALSKCAARFWSRGSFQGVEPVATGG
jgi:hypothetical protein